MRNDTIDPRLVQPNPWNTNVVSHENEEKLRESLRRHGFFRPLVVRELEDGTIEMLGGKHRVEQAIELGFDEIPIVNLGQIDDHRAKEISLIDNARYGSDDAMRLARLVSDLSDVDLSTILPWSEEEANSFTDSLAVRVEDLDLDDDPFPEAGADDEVPESTTRLPKTHEILRFKLSLVDAARARAKITAIMKAQGFVHSDDLTNAGDALMHALSQEVTDAEDA